MGAIVKRTPQEVLRDQTHNGKFVRYDIYLKILYLQGLHSGGINYETTYKKFLSTPAPCVTDPNTPSFTRKRQDSIPFKKLFQKILEQGYKHMRTIDVDANGVLVNGSHRLAICLYLDIPFIPVRYLDLEVTSISFHREWFKENGFKTSVRKALDLFHKHFYGESTIQKRGLLTYHFVYNTGAILQAYAQSKLLNTEVIDLVPQYYIDKQKKDPKRGTFDRFIQDNFLLTERRISNPSEDCSSFVNSLKKDLIIVGSDELWKLTDKSYPNIYWLGEEYHGKKVSCAVSANRLPYRGLSQEVKDDMKKRLSTFDLLGVRDQHTLNLLKHLGLEGIKVPDPTIAYDFDHLMTPVDFPEGKKLGIRFLYNSKWEYYASLVQEFKDHTAYSFGIKNKLQDKRMTLLDPFQWISAISQMDFLITDSFHHTIFAMKHGVPVICSESSSQNNPYPSKMFDLLKDLDMTHCYTNFNKDTNPKEKIKEVLKKHNPEKTQKALMEMRKKYTDFQEQIDKL